MFSLLHSHLLSATKDDIRERVHCAFANVCNKENDMPAAGGWMDGWMGAGQNSLSVLAQEKVT